MTAGELIWGAIVLYFIVMFIAMFVTSFGDVLRRKDLSGWAKAGWAIVLVALPLIGVLVYVFVRPKSADSGVRARPASSDYPSDRMPMMGVRP